MKRSVARATEVGVLDKAMIALEAIEAGAGTLGELVEATGFSRTTAHRLATALEAHGLVGRDLSRRWCLGPRLVALGAAATAGLSLRDALRHVARPILESLQELTGESAQLFVRIGDRRVCIEVAESTQELRTIVPVGAALPLTAGSAGKIFLAWTTDHDLDRLIEHVERLTPATLTDPSKIRAKVLTARRRGWADSVGERESGVASVSAPVLDGGGILLAVISVSGPIQRMGRTPGRAFAKAVQSAARQIESALRIPSARSPAPQGSRG